MKATEQYFPVVLFTMLYKVVLTFESVDEILKCDHSNETTSQYFPVVPIRLPYVVKCVFKHLVIIIIIYYAVVSGSSLG